MKDFGRRGRWIAGAGIGTAAFGLTATAQAADFTVTSLADDGSDGTLRHEVADALAAGAGNRVLFQSGLSGTITLTTGEISINKALEIQGPGAASLTINAHDASRQFYTRPTPANAAVKISGMTLVDGAAPGTGFNSSRGGSVFSYNANLTLDKMVITGGTAGTKGGAVASFYGSAVTISDSTLSGNSAGGSGGAIWSEGPTGTLQNSTITGNSATASPQGLGGGIYTYASSQFFPRAWTISNSTITGNQARSGGGIWHYQGTGSGGPRTPDTIKNSIVSGNTAITNAPNIYGAVSTQFTFSNDFTGATVTQTVPGSNITAPDPGLGALGDNGGPVPTMAPHAGSAVLDQGGNSTVPLDARGLTRPVDLPSVANSAAAGADGTDIGAVELASVAPQAPTVSIDFDPDPGRVGEPVTFTADADDVDGTVESIAWDFDHDGDYDDGDGSPEDHTFGATGTYTVGVEVTDNDGLTATDEVTIDVFAPPTVSADYVPVPAVAGEAVTFTADAADPDGTIDPGDIAWDFDDDGAFDDGTGTPIDHTFDSPGTYDVAVQVTDSDGVSTTDELQVEVLGRPTISVQADPLETLTGDPITFTADTGDSDGTIDPATDVAWDFDGDGDFDDGTGTPIDHAFDTPGTHTVTAQVTDSDDLTQTASVDVSIVSAPTVAASVNPTPVIAREEATFSADAQDIDGTIDPDDIDWDFDGDGQYDDGSGPQVPHTFGSPGPRSVSVKVTDSDGLTGTDTLDITVLARPIANFMFLPANPAAGQDVTFTNSSTDRDGTVQSLAWDFDGDGSYDDGTGSPVIHKFPAAGTYAVGLQATDNDGVSATHSVNVTVGPPLPVPPATFDLKKALKKCKKKHSKKSRKKCKKRAKKKAKGLS